MLSFHRRNRASYRDVNTLQLARTKYARVCDCSNETICEESAKGTCYCQSFSRTQEETCTECASDLFNASTDGRRLIDRLVMFDGLDVRATYSNPKNRTTQFKNSGTSEQSGERTYIWTWRCLSLRWTRSRSNASKWYRSSVTTAKNVKNRYSRTLRRADLQHEWRRRRSQHPSRARHPRTESLQRCCASRRT